MDRPPVDMNTTARFEDHWFEQRVDHFNKQDNRTYKQLYYIEDSHYKTGGPVFLLISGESEAGTFWLTNKMYMMEMAKKFGALAMVLEHRYYGRSVPTPDLSTENLKYLTVELALKDAEQFALYLTKKLSLESSKWVVFGGSYAGALVSWFRQKYPNIAVGAIASSATVGAVVNNLGYLEVVGEALGKECSNNIRKAHIEMANLLKTPEGVIKLRKILNLCQSFDGKNINDNHWLAETMMWSVAGVVQQMLNSSIIGETMNDPSGGTPLERIDKRQWMYQTCTQLGSFTTSDYSDCIFGHNIPIEYYTQQCTDIFGPQITAQTIQNAVDRTVATYGGLKPNVTNVVFPNGSHDPWKAIGVLNDLNNSTKAVVINNYVHCSDMYASSPSDTQHMKNAHKLIEQQIAEYLK
ncbi:unnamed protein product [Medioppia subpectinata]|uniref:Thymus-specific serine protease n=1 Tax=Medioppia subpectinata TaxID=1979941 RepID=A0A7R9PTZ1_9ACAR|nr:unnamed protein product [Medioppia subpectinata]CAG2100977.1 unnamed protein product [Medioppia subpectinata]